MTRINRKLMIGTAAAALMAFGAAPAALAHDATGEAKPVDQNEITATSTVDVDETSASLKVTANPDPADPNAAGQADIVTSDGTNTDNSLTATGSAKPVKDDAAFSIKLAAESTTDANDPDNNKATGAAQPAEEGGIDNTQQVTGDSDNVDSLKANGTAQPSDEGGTDNMMQASEDADNIDSLKATGATQ